MQFADSSMLALQVRMGALQCIEAILMSHLRPLDIAPGNSLANFDPVTTITNWSDEPAMQQQLLRQPSSTPLISFLASLLLTAAEGEVAAGGCIASAGSEVTVMLFTLVSSEKQAHA